MLTLFRIGAGRPVAKRFRYARLCTTQSKADDSEIFGDYTGPSESKKIKFKSDLNPKKVDGRSRRQSKHMPSPRSSSQHRATTWKDKSNRPEVDSGDVFGTMSTSNELNKTIIDYKTGARYDYDEDRSESDLDRESTESKISDSGENVEEVEKLFADEPHVTPFVVKKHSPEYFAKLERKLAEQGKIPEMVAVLEKRMKEDRVRPERGNFQEAIIHLGRHGQAKKAFQLVKQVQRMGLQPSAKMQTSLFNAYANCSPSEKEWAINETKFLLNENRSKYGSLRPAEYHAAIKAFSRHGETEWAFRVADFMVSDRVKPDLVTFVHLLHACVSDRLSGFKLALDVWRAMRAYGLKGNTKFYNNILRACRDCGLGPEGNRVVAELVSRERARTKRLLQMAGNDRSESPVEEIDGESNREGQFDEKRPVPTLDELNANLARLDTDEDEDVDVDRSAKTAPAVYISETNFKLALLHGPGGVLKLMDRDGADADVATFSLLLNLLPTYNVEEENQLINAMRQRRIVPNVDFMNDLISRHCRRHRFESALELLKELKKYDLQPNERTFSSLALGCAKYSSGISLLRDMEALGFKPNMHVMMPLLLNALKSNVRYDFIYARSILSWIKRQNLHVDKECLRYLEKCRRNAQAIEERRKISNLKHNTEHTSNDGLPAVRGLDEFLVYYEHWLKHVQLKDDTDEKLKLLHKEVTADDLREDWEKPWVAQAERQRQLEKHEKLWMVPVE